MRLSDSLKLSMMVLDAHRIHEDSHVDLFTPAKNPKIEHIIYLKKLVSS